MESEEKKGFMRRAIELAARNAENADGGPFGAVIVKDGRVISEGSNRVTVINDPTAHAEVNAIREACDKLQTYDLSGCELYTSCEPCPMCLSACYWAHIDKIYYGATQSDAATAGFDDEFMYKEFLLPKEERSLKTENFLREDGLLPFEIWINSEDKIPY